MLWKSIPFVIYGKAGVMVEILKAPPINPKSMSPRRNIHHNVFTICFSSLKMDGVECQPYNPYELAVIIEVMKY